MKNYLFDNLIGAEVIDECNIELAIKEFTAAARNGININNKEIQDIILNEYHINHLSLSNKEYIKRKVEEKLYGY